MPRRPAKEYGELADSPDGAGWGGLASLGPASPSEPPIHEGRKGGLAGVLEFIARTDDGSADAEQPHEIDRSSRHDDLRTMVARRASTWAGL